jgi:DNA-binding NarL/FixJ family response regulator
MQLPPDRRRATVAPVSNAADAKAMRQVREFLAEDARPAPARRRFAGLTPRGCDVLERMTQGLDIRQIAAHLNISEKTVRNNITPIFDKLAVEGRAQATAKAREAGLGMAKRPG